MVSTAGSRATRAPRDASGVRSILAEIRAEIRTCRLCPGMAPHRKGEPAGPGATGTGYVLVAEHPAPDAPPFRDAAGRLLRRALRDVGHPLYRELEDLFYLTYAVHCAPPHPRKEGRTRPPSRRECRTCLPYLQFELRALHPHLVVALGGKAAETLLDRPVRIREEHGRRHRRGDLEVLTLLAPSPANRVALSTRGLSLDGYRSWFRTLFAELIEALPPPAAPEEHRPGLEAQA